MSAHLAFVQTIVQRFHWSRGSLVVRVEAWGKYWFENARWDKGFSLQIVINLPPCASPAARPESPKLQVEMV